MRYGEFIERRRFSPTPTAFGTPVGGYPRSNFIEMFGIRKLDSLLT